MPTEPLYLQIKERLRKDIRDTQNATGAERLPTLNDLQDRYQVSRPTISKALAALVAEGLLVKEAGRGTFAMAKIPFGDEAATTLRMTIGFITPLYGGELPQNAFRGIDRIAHRSECRVLMAGSGDSVSQEKATALELIASGARGLIIYPTLRKGDLIAHDYLCGDDLGVPIVLIDTCTRAQGHAQVVFDNKRAGYQMTKWLIERGNDRIGVLLYTEEMHHPALEARYQGYLDAMRDHSLAVNPLLICRIQPADLIQSLEPVLQAMMALPHPPQGIITTDDTMAIEVIEILTHQGLHVPEDISVTGFDNLVVARRYQPAFTTTNPDFEALGEVACETLLEGINAGVLPPQRYIMPVPLLVRQNPHQNGLHTATAGHAAIRAAEMLQAGQAK